jgi:hypothetical protein
VRTNGTVLHLHAGSRRKIQFSIRQFDLSLSAASCDTIFMYHVHRLSQKSDEYNILLQRAAYLRDVADWFFPFDEG